MNSISMPLTTVDLLSERRGLEPRQRFGGVLFGVERQRRLMLAIAALVGELRVFFLQVRGVGQHQPAQIGGAAGAMHRALESLRDQPRQPAAVIDVRVREDDGVDRLGRDRQRRPVAQAQLLQALEQPAVEQDSLAIDFEEVLGAGHRAGGTEKRQRGHRQATYSFGFRLSAVARQQGSHSLFAVRYWRFARSRDLRKANSEQRIAGASSD